MSAARSLTRSALGAGVPGNVHDLVARVLDDGWRCKAGRRGKADVLHRRRPLATVVVVGAHLDRALVARVARGRASLRRLAGEWRRIDAVGDAAHGLLTDDLNLTPGVLAGRRGTRRVQAAEHDGDVGR